MITRGKQSGFALLMLLVVMIGIASLGMSNLLSSSVEQRNQQSRQENIEVLKQAKQALLSYAVNYAVENDLDKMGKLPCPDVQNVSTFPGDIEGNQDSTCGAKGFNAAGYFPYKTLGLGKIEDATSECLWYVVSGDYKNNIDADMLNWDSVGYLNVVDESGGLKHADSEEEFPIALIISPGASFGGNRAADIDMPNCKSNYTRASYLEGGANIDYSTDLPASADTLWSFLTTSPSAYLDSSDFNDQVIAIYPSEIWQRVKQLKDLDFDNSASVPAASTIELLTRSLAECIAEYGNDTWAFFRTLPFPAPVTLSDYRVDANYDDDSSILYGRFPQVVNNSDFTETDFVMDAAGTSYCESKVATAYDELLWKNWKDHFFYIVSQDFQFGSWVFGGIKCISNNCISVNPSNTNVAAMVIYAGEKQAGQNRVWWWDDATSSATVDEKSDQSNYLEGDNLIVYAGGSQNYTVEPTDYAYCISYSIAWPDYDLDTVKCANL